MKIAEIKVERLFQKTLFGVLCLFGIIGLSTSILLIYTVDDYLSEEYEDNSKDIAKTIADSSVDILLNRDLAALQSLIDQFVEIQGISYIYIADETGEFLAHTFVPGIPNEILADDPTSTETVEREIPGMGDFVEVGSPILAGVAGTVHVGMDTGVIALQVQRAIGRQLYLVSCHASYDASARPTGSVARRVPAGNGRLHCQGAQRGHGPRGARPSGDGLAGPCERLEVQGEQFEAGDRGAVGTGAALRRVGGPRLPGSDEYARYSLRTTPCIDAHGEL